MSTFRSIFRVIDPPPPPGATERPEAALLERMEAAQHGLEQSEARFSALLGTLGVTTLVAFAAAFFWLGRWTFEVPSAPTPAIVEAIVESPAPNLLIDDQREEIVALNFEVATLRESLDAAESRYREVEGKTAEAATLAREARLAHQATLSALLDQLEAEKLRLAEVDQAWGLLRDDLASSWADSAGTLPLPAGLREPSPARENLAARLALFTRLLAQPDADLDAVSEGLLDALGRTARARVEAEARLDGARQLIAALAPLPDPRSTPAVLRREDGTRETTASDLPPIDSLESVAQALTPGGAFHFLVADPDRRWNYTRDLVELASAEVTFTFRVDSQSGPVSVPIFSYDVWKKLVDDLRRREVPGVAQHPDLEAFAYYEAFVRSLPLLQKLGVYVDSEVAFSTIQTAGNQAS